MNDDPFLTIKQLAAHSGLHRNTLKLFMKRGMPYYRFGRAVRFKRSEFDEWALEFRRAEGAARDLSYEMEKVLREVRK